MKIAIETSALVDYVRERLGVGPDFDITPDGVTEVPFSVTPKKAADLLVVPRAMETGSTIPEEPVDPIHLHSALCRKRMFVGGKPLRRGQKGIGKGAKMVTMCSVTGKEVA